MAIRLLAVDLDGTLVQHDTTISPRVQAAVRTLVEDTDVRVVVATGRMFYSALKFSQTLGVREPIVTYQGAMTRHITPGHVVIDHTPIELSLAQAVLAVVQEMGIEPNLYIQDVLYLQQDSPFATVYERLSGIRPNLVPNLQDVLTAAPTKMLAVDDHRIDALMAALTRRFPGQLAVCRSRSNFCEIIDARVSKWAAVYRLAQSWGIEAHEIMAMGDQENDVSMLSQAGLGVAMGNAPPAIQALADVVTGSVDEDGAADAIERYILAGEPSPARVPTAS